MDDSHVSVYISDHGFDENHFEREQRRLRQHSHFHVQCANVHTIDESWGAGWSGSTLDDGVWRLLHNDSNGGALRIGNRWQPMHHRAVYLLPPGECLGVRMHGITSQLYVHVIEVTPMERFRQNCAGKVHELAVNDVLAANIAHCRHSCAEGLAMHSLLVGEACFHLALAELYATWSAQERATIRDNEADAALERCLADMAANPAEAWANDALAKRCHCHPDVFIRRFKRATGSTPARWLIQRRLDQVRDLLGTTSLTLDSIAARTGFTDRSHLIRHFKKTHGCSPTAWRQRETPKPF